MSKPPPHIAGAWAKAARLVAQEHPEEFREALRVELEEIPAPWGDRAGRKRLYGRARQRAIARVARAHHERHYKLYRQFRGDQLSRMEPVNRRFRR